MQTHARAKLGPAGRFALTEAIANGMSQKAAAAIARALNRAHRGEVVRSASRTSRGPV